MQIGLHPRRIVIDAKRQVDRVGDLEIELLDIGFRRANIGQRGDDRAIGAVRRRKTDILDHLLGRRAGAAIEKAMPPVRIFTVSAMIPLSPRAREATARRSSRMNRIARAAMLLLTIEQHPPRAKINLSPTVERRDRRDERSLDPGNERQRASLKMPLDQ